MNTPKDTDLTKFVYGPYENHLGQVLNTGDSVVMVTTGYGHSINIRKGNYIGTRYEKDLRTGEVTDRVASIVCEYDKTYIHYHLPYGNPGRYKPENYEQRTRKTLTNLYNGRAYKLETPAWEMRV